MTNTFRDCAPPLPLNDEPDACAHCEAPATHFLDGKDHDPCCDACYDKNFDACPNCGTVVYKDDIVAVQTARQTWSEPAEYTDMCGHCGPREDGPERDEDS